MFLEIMCLQVQPSVDGNCTQVVELELRLTFNISLHAARLSLQKGC